MLFVRHACWQTALIAYGVYKSEDPRTSKMHLSTAGTMDEGDSQIAARMRALLIAKVAVKFKHLNPRLRGWGAPVCFSHVNTGHMNGKVLMFEWKHNMDL
ncbi:hypothetical protein XENOCAPTIV_013077 [Xenoophorus captivus]|uniref:Uncharacterized protein n=1 Tax=Xenoophorus captivus TaxID=1517983 RepID=A0ABV0S6P6_9TELE